jgi:hypothetical protein
MRGFAWFACALEVLSIATDTEKADTLAVYLYLINLQEVVSGTRHVPRLSTAAALRRRIGEGKIY